MKGRALTCLDAEPHKGMERVGPYGFNVCTDGDEPLNQLGHLFQFLIKPNEDILLGKKTTYTNRFMEVTTLILNLSSTIHKFLNQ